MSIIGLIPGIPGVKTGFAATSRIVFKSWKDARFLPPGREDDRLDLPPGG